MRKQIICGLVLFVTLVFCFSMAPFATAGPADEVLQVVAKYDSGFNTGDFDLVSSVWWHSEETTSFGPIKPSSFRAEGWKQVVPRYRLITQLPKGSARRSRSQTRVTLLGDDTAIFTSYETVSIQIPAPNSQRETMLTRNTLVLQKIQGEWLIVHSHASTFPK